MIDVWNFGRSADTNNDKKVNLEHQYELSGSEDEDEDVTSPGVQA